MLIRSLVCVKSSNFNKKLLHFLYHCDILITYPQEVCDRVYSLQAQLSEAQGQAMQVQGVNDQLSTENSELLGQNDHLLQRAKDGEVRGEDLGQLLKIISEGVAEGNLKVWSRIMCSMYSTKSPKKEREYI